MDIAREVADAGEAALARAFRTALARARRSTLVRLNRAATTTVRHPHRAVVASDGSDDGDPATIVDPATLMDEAAWIESVDELIAPQLAGLVTDAANRVAVGYSFDVTDPAMAAAVARRIALITSWSQGLKDTVAGIVTQGMSEGWSVQRMAAAITDSGAMGEQRALMNARTQAIGAANAGTIEGFRATGDVTGKQWVATMDERTRPSHADADGQIVALDEAFSVGGEDLDYPGDPSGSDEETVNCRCTLIDVELPADQSDQASAGAGDEAAPPEDATTGDSSAELSVEGARLEPLGGPVSRARSRTMSPRRSREPQAGFADGDQPVPAGPDATDPAMPDDAAETGNDPADPGGAMVALVPDDTTGLVRDGGLVSEDLHLTLMFLGESLSADDAAAATDVVNELAGSWAPVVLTPFAVAEFNPNDNPAVVVLVESDELDDMREAVEEALIAAGITLPPQHAIFVPHITIGYGLDPADVTLPTGTITASTLRLAVEGQFTDVALTGTTTDSDGDAGGAVDQPTDTVDGDGQAEVPVAQNSLEGREAFATTGENGWEGVLVIEGIPSGDQRLINLNALTWRDLPIPLMCMFENSGYGHDGAALAGSIDTIERLDGGVIWATGTFDMGDGGAPTAGSEAQRLVAGKFLRGVSVDLDMVQIEWGEDDGMGDLDFDDDENMVVTSGRIMGACYDDATEVLTEGRGWVRFSALQQDERVATLDKTGALEWQLPLAYTNDPWSGPMIRFTAGGVQAGRRGGRRVDPARLHRSLDLLVTPNHRMLVESTKTGERVIMRADELAQKSNRSYRFVATSEWTAPDVDEVVIDGSYRRGNDAPLVMKGDDYAAFMGAWLSEGSSANGKRLHISQRPGSKGYGLFARLAEQLGGSRDPSGFVFYNARLVRHVAPLGTARQKYLPAEVKNLSARQLRIFLENFTAGDGDVEGRRLYTSSERMAGELQEVAQKVGMWAVVSERDKPPQEFEGRTITANGPGYVVAVRNRPGSRPAARIWDWKAETIEHHEGMVRCVTVPNEILYVRRNGIPAWAGNTLCPFPAFQEAMIGLPGTVTPPAVSAPAEDGAAPAEDVPAEDGASISTIYPSLPALAADGSNAEEVAEAIVAWVEETGRLMDLDDTEGSDGAAAVRRAVVASAGRGVEAVVFTPLRQEGRTMAIVASAGAEIPVHPPAAWFAKMQYEAPFPVRVSAEGRITGYAAPPEGSGCHVGSGRGPCVKVPRCSQGYRKFQNRTTLTAEGTMVATGVLYMDTVHPNLLWDASDTEAFYAKTGCGVADVHVYVDEHGLQLAGAVRPTARPAEIRALRGSDVSPDWRPDRRHGHYMVGLLAVNVSGFIQEDDMEALVASCGGVRPGTTRALVEQRSGALVALVASAGLARERVSPRTDTAALAARLDRMEAALAPIRRERAKALLAQARAARTT